MFSMMIGSFLTEALVKTFHQFPSTYVGKGIIAISFVLFLIPTNMYVAIISFVLFDFGLSISEGAIGIWQHDYISGAHRASYYSAISSVRSIAGIIITCAIGFIIEYSSFRILWVIAFVFEIFSIIGLSFFIRKYKDQIEEDDD